MGRKQKRGKAGNAAQYLTRNQAIKKLQLRLSEFRRLCILKGIHPREPKKKPAGGGKTYYHAKDIAWLAHEPLIHTFRAIKVHERRVRKAASKQQLSLARRLMSGAPGYKLDHLVKERYPSFIDALRDLDDPLSLITLYATLPGEARAGIRPATVDKCRRLVLEWTAYVCRTSALRGVFVSVKGFYFQAEVAGCRVTWLVPHQLAQVLPSDVDYAVMSTFLEFYACLAQFVLFKLYHDIGLRYPPVMDRRLEAAAAGLAGLMRDIAAATAADSAAAAAAAQQQQQQQQLEAGAGAAPAAAAAGAAQPAAAALPDVVARLGTLGRKIKELQAAQQAGGDDDGSGSDGDGELPAIDSGSGSGSEDEGGSEEGGASDEPASEEQEGEEPASGSEEQRSSGGDDGDSDDDAAGGASSSGAEDEGQQQPAGQAQQQQQQQPGAEPASGADAGTDAGAALAGGGLAEVSPDDDAALCGVLLKGVTFFLAREVPREPLLFIIRSFGGVAGWEGEGSPVAEADESIDYQIVDRPTQGHRYLSRSYVQPQWLFDSVNHRVLMPAQLYAPGVKPPPHLSPFVDNEAEGYTPEFAATIKQLQDAARAARRAAAGAAREAAFLGDGAAGGDDDDAAAAAAPGAGAAADEAALQREYARELAKELKAAAGGASGSGSASEDGGEDGSGSGSEDDAAEPAQAGAASGSRKRPAAAGPAARGGEEDEALMGSIMMSRKTRKLYGRINRAIEGKAERVAVLQQRKAALDAAAQGDSGAEQAGGGGRRQRGKKKGKQ